jgi:HAD superfamily hydrolase (TIGR01549 family)
LALPALFEIHAALFDLDGTLVDSHLDFAALRRETGFPEGLGLLEHLETLTDAQARADAEAIIHAHELSGARRAAWMPGASALLNSLAENGVALGIVTRNSRHSASLMIEALDIPCDQLVAREDAPAKPDPAGLLQIASQWKISPAQIAYTGDYLFDLQAARAAGMVSCLYAPAGSSPFEHLSDVTVADFSQWRDHFCIVEQAELTPD